jgi:hypothetical protein
LEQAKSSIKVDTLTLCEEEWGLKDQNMEWVFGGLIGIGNPQDIPIVFSKWD